MPPRMPHTIKENDLVALLGPASPLSDDKAVEESIRGIEAIGLRVKTYPSAYKKHDYLAGTDRQRAADLTKAFADPRIKAIFCIRGGYGSSRLLPMIDWKAAGDTRKPFMGFSDITSVIGALQTKGNLVSCHGPMGVYLRNQEKATESRQDSMRKILFEGYRGLSLKKECGSAFKCEKIVKGKATGQLVGGNLSLFAGLCGTPWMPKAKRSILFLEELSENPYKLDRYITQLINAGFFRNVAGIALGDFSDCDPKAPDKDDWKTVLKKCLSPLKVPMIAGLPIGHCRPTWTLPMGATVELDANKGDLKFL